MDWEKVSEELAKPLNKAHVKPAKAYGPKGDYIEAWHAQAEANRIFGFGGWTQEVVETMCVSQRERAIGKDEKPGWGVTYTARVRVTVDGVAREDFGAGHGYDVDLGLAHESAIKESVSDAMKRSLKSFGNPFGLALYDKTQANVADPAEIERQRAQAEEDRLGMEKFTADIISRIQTMTEPAQVGALLQKCQGSISAIQKAEPEMFKRIEVAAKNAGAPMREVA